MKKSKNKRKFKMKNLKKKIMKTKEEANHVYNNKKKRIIKKSKKCELKE